MDLKFTDLPLGWFALADIRARSDWSLHVKVCQWHDGTAVAKDAIMDFINLVVRDLELVKTRVSPKADVEVRMSEFRQDEVIITLEDASLILRPVMKSVKKGGGRPFQHTPFVNRMNN